VSEPVTFINCFDVPEGRDEAFQALWEEVNAYMTGQPGYLGHRLHRSIGPGAGFRFINVAWWESAERWQQAHDDGFRRLVGKPEWAEFGHTPTLCEVVHQGGVVADVGART
jgi:heme-degrading monooxygenase HmoA